MAADVLDSARMPYLSLRALTVGGKARLLTFVGANLAAGLYAVHVGEPGLGVDLLHDRDEAFWHTWGLDDAGRGGTVAPLADEPLPPLLTLDQAAEQLGIGLEALDKRIDMGALYPLYGYRRARLVFAGQVAALAGHRDAEPAWEAVQMALPPLRPIPDGFAPTPVPDPLPIPLDLQETARWGRALAIAGDEGFCHLVHADLAGGPDAAVYRLEVLFRGRRVPREIPGHGLLPYLRGLADGHGLGHLLAYRQNLRLAA